MSENRDFNFFTYWETFWRIQRDLWGSRDSQMTYHVWNFTRNIFDPYNFSPRPHRSFTKVPPLPPNTRSYVYTAWIIVGTLRIDHLYSIDFFIVSSVRLRKCGVKDGHFARIRFSWLSFYIVSLALQVHGFTHLRFLFFWKSLIGITDRTTFRLLHVRLESFTFSQFSRSSPGSMLNVVKLIKGEQRDEKAMLKWRCAVSTDGSLVTWIDSSREV